LVEYLGEQDDVRPFIAESHVLVLPSYREGMPRTVLEAASMGRPAIVTDVPGCRQAVVNGETGWPPAGASRRSSTSAWWCGRLWIASRVPARNPPSLRPLRLTSFSVLTDRCRFARLLYCS